ncbi:hypothetical protein [Campylobacter sp.]|uniref:hypothetical protein n=1 Tax=Campylobacter sp. TaxID=205 RepID=UPI002A7F46FE|nr:hypothetical protein [Campylobacter sp.]MDY4804127.1 hypothetical protein [Campylobacter sp.]
MRKKVVCAAVEIEQIVHPKAAQTTFFHTSTTILESPLNSVFVGFSHTALYFDSRYREFRIPRILEFPSKFTINFLKYFERFIVNLFFTYYKKGSKIFE